MSSNKGNIELDVEEALEDGNAEKAREIIQNNLEYISRLDSFHPITGKQYCIYYQENVLRI